MTTGKFIVYIDYDETKTTPIEVADTFDFFVWEKTRTYRDENDRRGTPTRDININEYGMNKGKTPVNNIHYGMMFPYYGFFERMRRKILVWFKKHFVYPLNDL